MKHTWIETFPWEYPHPFHDTALTVCKDCRTQAKDSEFANSPCPGPIRTWQVGS